MSIAVSKRMARRPPAINENSVLQYREVTLTAAECIASNATYPVIIPSPGLAKGIILIRGVLNIFGGATDYDQDCDTTLQYTDNTGIAVSATLDDVFNDGTAGSAVFLVPAAAQVAAASVNELTEIGITANAPVVLVNTASPSSDGVVGDRLCRVCVWYLVVDIKTY